MTILTLVVIPALYSIGRERQLARQSKLDGIAEAIRDVRATQPEEVRST